MFFSRFNYNKNETFVFIVNLIRYYNKSFLKLLFKYLAKSIIYLLIIVSKIQKA